MMDNNPMEKPTPPCSLSEMLADIDAGGDAIYDGPGAHTIADMIEESPFAQGTLRERADDMVKAGDWVQVKIQRTVRGTNKAHYPLAWVKKDVYDDWKAAKGVKKGDTKKLKVDINV